jgi:hypothetical protein
MTIESKITRRTALTLLTATVASRGAWAAVPLVTVHKDPNCGCCSGWVAHLEVHGFQVKTIETKAINRLKAKLGVPFELIACHTAEVDGFLIEGHVPAVAIKRLLAERPKARGLAVPGMPSGSPGMDGEFEEYQVILFDGKAQRVYGRFKGDKEV